MDLNVSNSILPMQTRQLVFGWIDYSIFIALLGISLLIGVYFGIYKKQNSTSEYLFGGKRMNYIAVATSILASLLSGITFLGIPTEVYLHGSQYFTVCISAFILGPIIAYIVIPHFNKLQISSSYEYLELRFTQSIRTLAASLYIISLFVYMPVVIYVPALAFSQVTGFSVHAITPIFSLVCITYTSMGGIKAVVWTDTIQFFFTIAGLSAVLIIGLISIGGVSELWRIADEGQRLQFFNMDPSPFKKNTFWVITVGMTVSMLSRFGLGQKFVQRFLAVKSQAEMKKAVLLTVTGWAMLQAASVFIGLLMYASYHNCDPLKAKLVNRIDQTLPYYVMDIGANLRGLPGIFLAGIVSSALSTMSASLNTLAGTIYKTYINRHIADDPKRDSKAANIMKVISVIAGLITIGAVFVIERLGTVFEMAISFSSVTEGALLGLFTVGMLCPWVGKKGAITGAYVSLVIMGWIVGSTQWYIMNKKIMSPSLPTSIDACPNSINETLAGMSSGTTTMPDRLSEEKEEEKAPMIIYHLAVLYYTLLGSLIVIVVSCVTSFVVGETDLSKVEPDHILPFMRRFLPRKRSYMEIPIKDIERETNYDAKH
ncbi:PREDICTED: sodium-coupled monocarboxylate transporter 1-like [Ceratosolen solmsi marchali]|uniref:Sodium-coupled monocarboxylate transporter 1-like n=1 Tax=Ceratosolen solmsi marchali TaxID=326594 RepID=A0AAJ7DUE6_9HYME|nr:PREDICTED: sodium-coupled monocarboxylate transporter 1-like [Ceratosolen solmsi marchali]